MNKRIFLFTLLLTLVSSVNAQDKKHQVITSSFEVAGVCSMCEERIEKALDIKGVKVADYVLDTHMLEVTYSTKHLSEEDIHRLLNEAGHDTEKMTASDEQYDTVHGCCKYRDHEHNH